MNEIKDYWQVLKAKVQDFQFIKTKYISDKLETNVKILNLLNEKIESVSQISNYGLIVLNQTILSSHDTKSVSEQGIISNDFFKAKVLDVSDTIVQGVYFHLVKVISGIITINPDYKLTLTADEEFRKNLLANKLVAKLFNLFLRNLFETANNFAKNIKVTLDDKNLNLKISKQLDVTKAMIFKVRDNMNEFLAEKRINYQKYPFLKDITTKSEKEIFAKLDLIEIKNLVEAKNNFSVDFLVGQEKVNSFLLENKKELLSGIKIINQKIKLINSEELSEFYPDSTVDSYEKLEKLTQDFLQLKERFVLFQNQNPELIKNLLNDSVAMQYSEKIGDYEFIHSNFNNLLIDQELLELKAQEKIADSSDRVLFLSNNNFDNSMVILKISDNLVGKINFLPLVNQFSNPEFKKNSYNNQDTVFIEANNYQVVSDFISNIINFFKISNNQTIS